jgi:hypothetical protein
MFGLLCGSKAVCERDWAFRVVVLGAQKSPQIGLGKVVLSGFPTALEPTLRRLSLGTDAGALASEEKANQLLLPRDDIPPPPPAVVAPGICRLRLARTYGSFTLRLHSRVQYGTAGENSFLVGSRSRS